MVYEVSEFSSIYLMNLIYYMNRSFLSSIISNNYNVIQRDIKIFNRNFSMFDIIVIITITSKGTVSFWRGALGASADGPPGGLWLLRTSLV